MVPPPIQAGKDFKISFIIARYPPLSGGTEAQAKRLAESLAERGAKVTVLTRAFPGLPLHEEDRGVTVRRLWVPGSGAVASAAFLCSLRAVLLQERDQFDIYHLHLASSHAILAGYLAPQLGVPTVLKFGATREFGDVGTSKKKPGGQWKLDFLKNRIDAFVCTSREMQEEVTAEGFDPSRTHLIPNGVDTNSYKPLSASEREKMRQQLGLDSRPTTLFSGRLAPQKGLEFLLDAWKEVLLRQPEALLIIAGSGDLQTQLTDEAEELGVASSLRFTGQLEPEVLKNYYQAVDLFVLPSLAEGLSNALLEAMACGLPVVASRVGGNEDAVLDGINGHLVEPAQAAPLANAIIGALEDRAAASAMGLQGRKSMEANYSMGAVTDRYLELYRGLVGLRERG
ncbi:MAG: glycosyltransferase family 4 protein [Nitrospirota bacterium]|nr:glycosyltransferase family 4 protein [Nitrospirota bacterium]